MVATNAPGGSNSCLSVDFRSTLVGEGARAESRRRSDLEGVNIHLYSDRQSDLGSSSLYDGSVSAAPFTLLVATTPSILLADGIEALGQRTASPTTDSGPRHRVHQSGKSDAMCGER